jgi:hypothetical protein
MSFIHRKFTKQHFRRLFLKISYLYISIFIGILLLYAIYSSWKNYTVKIKPAKKYPTRIQRRLAEKIQIKPTSNGALWNFASSQK